jgi:hypothetical protein
VEDIFFGPERNDLPPCIYLTMVFISQKMLAINLPGCSKLRCSAYAVEESIWTLSKASTMQQRVLPACKGSRPGSGMQLKLIWLYNKSFYGFTVIWTFSQYCAIGILDWIKQSTLPLRTALCPQGPLHAAPQA